VATVALLAYGAVALRACWEARRELRLGHAALGARDPLTASTHLGRALRWYVPASPYNSAAAASLAKVGAEAELHGQPDTALAAYRQLRRGLQATRHLWVPQPGQLALANARIAELMAAQGEHDSQGRPASFAQRRAEHALLLERSPAPSTLGSVLALLGFFGWVGAALLGIQLGLDDEGRVRRRPRLSCGAAGVLLFVVWLLGLWIA